MQLTRKMGQLSTNELSFEPVQGRCFSKNQYIDPIPTNRWLWLIPLQELSLWIMQEINSQAFWLTQTARHLVWKAVQYYGILLDKREGESTVHMTSQLTESVTVPLTLNTSSRSLTRWSCTPCQEWEVRV